MSNQAEDIYARFYNLSAEAEEAADTDYERSVWAKLQIYVIKLAAISALTHTFSQGMENCGCMISASDMSWAVDMAHYLHGSQMRMIEKISNGTPSLTKKQVLKQLAELFPGLNKTKLAEGLGISAREIRRYINQ